MPHPPHPLASTSQILATPSSRDGIPKALEDDLRVAGCMLIQNAGVMLELPQSTMAIAQVVFHRFFYVSSMCSFGITDTAISALYLSSKLNETPVRLRDLINTCIFLRARIEHLLSLPADQPLSSQILLTAEKHADEEAWGWRVGMNLGTNGRDKGKEKERDPVWEGFTFDVPGFHDEIFWDWKDVIVSSEMQILKRLGFNMQVDLPYSHVINYLKILDLVFEPDVAQSCWSILNDALLTPLYALHPPHTLAVSSIYLSARLLRLPLPKDWYILFDASIEDVHLCASTIMRLYHDWGVAPPKGAEFQSQSRWEAGRKGREDRWRRAWVLMEGRRVVRKWVEERDKWETTQPASAASVL